MSLKLRHSAGDDANLLKLHVHPSVVDDFASFSDTVGSLQDSGINKVNVQNAIDLAHARLHGLQSALDHTSTSTEHLTQIADVNGLPTDSAFMGENTKGVGCGTFSPNGIMHFLRSIGSGTTQNPSLGINVSVGCSVATTGSFSRDTVYAPFMLADSGMLDVGSKLTILGAVDPLVLGAASYWIADGFFFGYLGDYSGGMARFTLGKFGAGAMAIHLHEVTGTAAGTDATGSICLFPVAPAAPYTARLYLKNNMDASARVGYHITGWMQIGTTGADISKRRLISPLGAPFTQGQI